MRKYAGIIVRCGNKVLLCKRNALITSTGIWSCPAGSVDKGESTKDASIREFIEETDLPVIGDIEFIGIIKRYNRDGSKIKGLLYCYLMDVDEEMFPDLENAVDGDEHTECAYFSKGNLPSPMTKQLNKLINIILK